MSTPQEAEAFLADPFLLFDSADPASGSSWSASAAGITPGHRRG
ncbi:hypothetical protein [Cyanobium sp. ATX 6A2]|nr:hypothetical protein [Cyanobium sp. ATX 6A2]